MTNLSLIIILSTLIILPKTSFSKDIVPRYVQYACPKGKFTYTSGSTFESNLTNILLNILPTKISPDGFSKFSVGEESVDQIYALSYCRGDVTGGACRGCVEAAARSVLQRCRLLKEGIVWYEECTLRYANRSDMFSVQDFEVTPNHRHYNFSGIFRFLEKEETIFDRLMNGLIDEASNVAYVGNLSGFAKGESNLSGSDWVLRALVQCRQDIVGVNCELCLRQALRQRDGWNTPMVFLPSCYIQFDLYPYAHLSPHSKGDDGISITIIALVVIVGGLLLCCSIYLVLRYCKQREHSHQSQDHPRKFTMLELVWATTCFASRKILGRGGFGNVYEGTLFDGSKVAVKRLNAYTSLQGDTEFNTEVAAIANLNHHNVVSLKGYCSFLRERILVYEYVPNKTLEYHLHGYGQKLSWEKRMAIAISLAEVLAFLHEKEPAIIHRDIKPTNILIDSEFNLKVGDFGVAKVFPESRTHMTTIVKGSEGYLDPYYFASQQLTRKSDVFAFGVILLELITGRRATFLLQDSTEKIHIMYWAEPLIKEGLEVGNFEALVDQNLTSIYDCDQMDRMVICAAACVRISLDQRPTMTQVAEVLKESSVSNELFGELKERLQRLWQAGPHKRISFSSSSEITVGQIMNDECSRSETPTTNYGSCSFRNFDTPDLYNTASPTHPSAA
ncbi:proline-rich receptor-like protein kinase PERK3 [Amaranthus tricolor]|uniref:proline-rich receptor-like protein kinase PERK3 n=1 Tax=Amaranthus tricolor TaxID=29722 RepID=UPI002582E3F4|nr:proline-rich receptor-like protein kinase PERK3 [Amaranthus tricolor]